MAEMHDECGVVAVYQFGEKQQSTNVYPVAVRGLLDIQNRGQLSAGITTYQPTRNRILQTHKDIGTVSRVFYLDHARKGRELLEQYAGFAAIAQNRYATSGANDVANAQPFERVHGRTWKWFAIAFNGNLANYDALKTNLEKLSYHITYHSDTEVMMHYINYALRGDTPPDFANLFGNLSQRFDGAYNIVFLNALGDLVALRDPLGFHPLCYGIKNDMLVVASESVVHRNLDIDKVVDLAPGEMIVANKKGFRITRYASQKTPKHCFFEWIYFAHLASSLDGCSVQTVRANIGEQMAIAEKEHVLCGDIVCPVPETAKTAANAFAFHLGLPLVEGLLRNRYIGRSFIESQADRSATIQRKFSVLNEMLQGKRMYLVDDSLVRGATLKAVIAMLRNQGRPKEIHVRIGAPPVVAPCYYGIDMARRSELFANQFVLPKIQPNTLPPQQLADMAAFLGADSLQYLSHQRLGTAIGLPQAQLCMACINNQYPTKKGIQRAAADSSGLF